MGSLQLLLCLTFDSRVPRFMIRRERFRLVVAALVLPVLWSVCRSHERLHQAVTYQAVGV